MKFMYVLFIAFLSLPVLTSAQSTIIDDNGNYDITIEDAGTGKDPLWSSITLFTSKAIKAKEDTEVVMFGTTYTVAYNASKEYVLSCDGTHLLTTTTIAAIRQTINSHIYEKKTGIIKTS